MKFKPLPLLGFVLGLGFTSATARERSFGDGLPEFLQQFDTNEDGRIGEEERQAIREIRQARHADWIAQWDTSGDGMLSREEREAAREAIRAAISAKRAARFAEIAGDDDSLDADEFATLPTLDDVNPRRVSAIFARLDANNDGGVTLEEFTARLRHHRKPDNGGGPLPPLNGGDGEQ